MSAAAECGLLAVTECCQECGWLVRGDHPLSQRRRNSAQRSTSASSAAAAVTGISECNDVIHVFDV